MDKQGIVSGTKRVPYLLPVNQQKASLGGRET